ncbi:dUTP diphosphatase [Brumicola nitratireducens]|nr:dUTP diphosphatase [Glaciecola nitratireducens]
MLTLQNSMNYKVNSDWLQAGNDWSLAAMMEATEAIDHHGWKWWKHQEPDMDQLQMELVDIWHFILSGVMEEGCHGSIDTISEIMLELIEETKIGVTTTDSFNGLPVKPAGMTLVELLKLFAGSCASGLMPTHVFLLIVERSGMTTDDLYKQYIGKNVLNFFRQDNGYKDGTYQKIWAGREDNEHLTEILQELDATVDDFETHLYDALGRIYKLATKTEAA